MLKRTVVILLCALFSTTVLAGGNGLIKKKSAHSVKVTLDRLENVLKKKGIGIAVRWNHAAKAKGVGMEMRDTEILIFGNPKMGSPLMMSNQEVGIDLPMKALVYKDAKGQVWLVYNDPAYLKNRHGISDKDPVFKKMTGALNNLTNKAVGKE
jgi:uncharacterized protein (DUF302 family)